MANPELSQRIQELPEELLGLEREPGIVERLRRIDALKDRARALDPLDGVEDMALADYDRDWLVRYTYNSNAIEGSTLTLEDTSLVLEGEFVPSDSPARYVFAARGVADGMAYVREYAREGSVPFDAGLYRFWFFGKTVSGSVGIPVSRSSRIFLSLSTSSRSLSIWRSF